LFKIVEDGFVRVKAEDVKRYYLNGEFYDWVTQPKQFEKIFHSKREKAAVMLIERYCKGSIALDIGCGTGLITRHLRSNLIIGLDINKWNLKRAKMHFKQIEAVVGDAENLPIRSKSINIILYTETLEHIPNPRDAISEAVRVLAPKGKIIGSVPCKNPVWKFRKVLLTTCPVSEPFHRSYSVKMLKQLLGGLKIIDIFKAAFFTTVFFIAENSEVI